jgi:hypothetical protein
MNPYGDTFLKLLANFVHKQIYQLLFEISKEEIKEFGNHITYRSPNTSHNYSK